MKFKDYIFFEIENPLKTYNKIKNYFKPLTRSTQFCKVYLGSGYPLLYQKYGKILDIRAYDVVWKDKWNDPRHEYNPCVNIVFFNKWKIFIQWSFKEYDKGKLEDHSCEYWEAALSWLYYKKDLYSSVKENTGWYNYDSDGNKTYNTYKLLNDFYQYLYDRNDLNVPSYEKIRCK